MNSTKLSPIPFNPELDLRIERRISVPRALVWRCWTDTKLIPRWFCPRPWGVGEVKIDLRPGGQFYTVITGPNGESFPGDGCFLEVVPERRLVWTDALGPGWRPAPSSMFTGVIELEDAEEGGTIYRATAMHGTPEAYKSHAEMGFTDGWNKALDQLIEVAGTL